MQPSIRNRKRTRRGAAVVELAVCMPLIALLVFASLEGANMLFLRQAVVQSAYEAAKVAARADGSQARAQRLANDILASRNINPSQISFSPSNVDSLDAGTIFTVTVSAAGDQKSITTIGPFGGLNIEAQATMHKE
ncbi:MAG: TadE/TadG family type IV pilus assembly protein [Planctomycetota bacterium]